MSRVLADADNAVSPFNDEGVQYAWDSTSLGLLKTCPRLYYLSMLCNWQPKRTSHHLTFGIHYHKALEIIEHELAKGADRESALRTAVRETLIAERANPIGEDPKGLKNLFSLLRTIVWHFDHYENDSAQTVILANGKPATELSFRFEIGNGLILCGHLDNVVQFGDHRYVRDFKTSGSTLGSYYFEKFNPDNQMTLYSLAARIAFGEPVVGVIIDATQIAVGFSAFARDVTLRSERQLNEFIDGVYAWHATATAYTRSGFWPMNETACDNYGGCRFKAVCRADPAVRDRILATDFTQEYAWNPLQER